MGFSSVIRSVLPTSKEDMIVFKQNTLITTDHGEALEWRRKLKDHGPTWQKI